MLRCQLELRAWMQRGVKRAWACAGLEPKLSFQPAWGHQSLWPALAKRASSGASGQQGVCGHADPTLVTARPGVPGLLCPIGISVPGVPRNNHPSFTAPCGIHRLAARQQRAGEGETTAGPRAHPTAQVASWWHPEETWAGTPALNNLPLIAVCAWIRDKRGTSDLGEVKGLY